MPKAYWIAHVTVTDPDPYALYAKGASEAFARYGAEVLARGGRVEPLEGEAPPRNVVIAFPDIDAALACYRSDEYQAAKRHRDGAGDAQIMIVEGI
jgi:uncharacterized protein (DUF1330 family)